MGSSHKIENRGLQSMEVVNQEYCLKNDFSANKNDFSNKNHDVIHFYCLIAILSLISVLCKLGC